MKKAITRLFTLCLAFVCVVAVFVGCGPTKRDPKEIIGVYVLKKIQVFYTDGTRKVHDVDSENNENEMLKELSSMVYKYYGDRYEVKKNSGEYVFNKLRYNSEVENYVTIQSTPVTAEWESANNCFVLKEGPDGSYKWHYINLREGGYYYEGPQFGVNNSVLEVEEFRSFMQENDITHLMLRYVLEK